MKFTQLTSGPSKSLSGSKVPAEQGPKFEPQKEENGLHNFSFDLEGKDKIEQTNHS